MNLEQFTDLMKDSKNIDQNVSGALNLIIQEHPYFQTARALYLKGLKDNQSFKYNSEIKTTAAYTSDRTILFDFITSFKEVKSKSQNASNHQPLATQKRDLETKTTIKEDLGIGAPLKFTDTETHSFNEWLQLATYKKIDRSIPENKPENKSTIIDNFIKKNPKISKVKKDADSTILVEEAPNDSYLMTETLAKVYLEQKKYENAIKAYDILSLKYPEKSGFFADQIKRIRILQKNKS